MKLNQLIPGGAHTYSKGNDVFPSNAPEYLVKADGCYVWDEKGHTYLDWAMGLRSVILGHSNPQVNEVVIRALKNGTNFCRPTLYEEELALLLANTIPSAEMVKFGKSGSDVTSAAVKLARAYTGRTRVLVARENPFISQHDWFIGTTKTDGGIPWWGDEYHGDYVQQYSYNNLTMCQFEDFNWSLEDFCHDEGHDIAAIVLDPSTVDVTREKLKYLRDLCTKYGIIFILDEIISGFRYDVKGVQGLFGVVPDLSTFGKSIANGYSVSALCGKCDIMKLGDREYGDVFLLSGTYNAETPALAAAIETITQLKFNDSISRHIGNIGEKLVSGINAKIRKNGLEEYMSAKYFSIDGVVTGCNPLMTFKNLVVKTLFDQYMVDEYILMPYIAPSYAHSLDDVEATCHAAGLAMRKISQIIKMGDSLEKYLYDGWVEKPVFRKSRKD